MIINSEKNIFVYNSDEPLDLMNGPSDTQSSFYSEYHTFINSVLIIYGNQKVNGSIPVFWTKLSNDGKSRYPDINSTLKILTPNNSYYVVCVSDAILPIKVPKPLDSVGFLNKADFQNNTSLLCDQQSNCCEDIKILSDSHHNIILTNISGYSYSINLPISGLQKNKNYTYSIDPIYSNWPAKLSSVSGEIKRAGQTNHLGLSSGIISSIFSYYPSGDDYSNSITYDNISTNNLYVSKNIFTLLNINIQSNNCAILNDTINIKCNDCLPNFYRECPTIKLDNDENIILSGENNVSTTIRVTYDKLDPTKEYTLFFNSAGANWPCKIDPQILTIKPESLYVPEDTNLVYGSGQIDATFTFAPIMNVASWSNLAYYLDPFSDTEEFIGNNIYCLLRANLYSGEETVCSQVFDTNIIKCSNCLAEKQNCIDNLVINFIGSSLNYPDISNDIRPGAEFTVDEDCCSKDQILTVQVSGACCGELYDYKLSTSNSLVDVMPLSGTVSFGDGTGRIAAIYNLNNRPGASIRFRLIHKETGQSAVDNILVRCPNRTPILPSN